MQGNIVHSLWGENDNKLYTLRFLLCLYKIRDLDLDFASALTNGRLKIRFSFQPPCFFHTG